MSNECLLYFCGVDPISHACSSQDRERLYRTISKEPLDVRELRKLNKIMLEFYLGSARLASGGGLLPSLSNDKNGEGFPILDFSPFDISYHCDENGRVSAFTRDEFPSLIRTRIHPKSGKRLHESYLSNLRSRILMSEVWRLPSCEPLASARSNLRRGMFKVEKVEQEREQPNFEKESEGSSLLGSNSY